MFFQCFLINASPFRLLVDQQTFGLRQIRLILKLIIAQRLARKLCDSCKEVLDIPAEALLAEGFTQEEIDNDLRIYGAVGCKACDAGYKGRAGIFQVMPVSDATARIIMSGGNATDIADQAAKEGWPDLRRAGLNKAREGITSLDEINRVTVG